MVFYSWNNAADFSRVLRGKAVAVHNSHSNTVDRRHKLHTLILQEQKMHTSGSQLHSWRHFLHHKPFAFSHCKLLCDSESLMLYSYRTKNSFGSQEAAVREPFLLSAPGTQTPCSSSKHFWSLWEQPGLPALLAAPARVYSHFGGVRSCGDKSHVSMQRRMPTE